MENLKKTSCTCSKLHPLKKSTSSGDKKMNVLNILSGVLLFLFPKCPLCWAAYASIFSFVGIEQVSINTNWRFLILGIFLLGSFFLLRKHYLNKSWFSIILYGLGMSLLLTTYYLNYSETWLLYLVLFLILLSNISIRNDHKLMKLFKRSFEAST
ncbi:hypothetical protein QLS71_016380 [Mariniflexile litorale]|uniref:MerC mercury resistance protein n=1 Tax=Mariniflexile litorale TaxID=3045158 RepID=A0AAU7ECK0_9FLAO|nr:hypothetical protein [Mariniflexile sp. KMM 9835]MDQ8212277.1 hypothetical protein [Mariniflexile sp. KMM 9835]